MGGVRDGGGEGWWGSEVERVSERELEVYSLFLYV